MNPSELFDIFEKNEINFYCGVPDSLLKDFTNYVKIKTNNKSNITAANEGNAIAIAAGYYLQKSKLALVYLQNSGLGNCINPITSLTDRKVYAIPMILLIGWRGYLGKNDEPQHLKQGQILKNQLKLLGIKFLILEDRPNLETKIEDLIKYSRENKSPVADSSKKKIFLKNIRLL